MESGRENEEEHKYYNTNQYQFAKVKELIASNVGWPTCVNAAAIWKTISLVFTF